MKFWLYIPFTMILMSCASHPVPTNPEPVDIPNVPEAYKNSVSYLKPSDRTPASMPREYWETATREFAVGPQGIHLNYDLPLNQILEWDEVENYSAQCDQLMDVRSEEPVRVLVKCQNSISSEPWSPRTLAAAIKGIGPKSADALFANGYFVRKPQTWNEFATQLEKANARGIIQGSVVTAALVTYMDENMATLGYDRKTCQYRTETRVVWREKFVSVPCVKQRTLVKKTVKKTIMKHVEVTVENPKLQNFEQDKIRFTTSETPDVKVEGGPYTRYDIQKTGVGDAVLITLTGTDRNLVDLPQDALDKVTLSPYGDKYQMRVSVIPQYIPDHHPNDQLVLAYTLNTCKLNWFGMCGIEPWTASETNYLVIRNSLTEIPIDIPYGKKGMVRYQIQRKNSPFYNDNFVHTGETDSYKGR